MTMQTLPYIRSAIATGGTVMAGALDLHGTPLAATSAGVFRRDDGAWTPLPDQPNIAFPQAFLAAERTLLLGGAGAVVFSTDGGVTWKRGQTSALEQPVTCFAAAPDFAHSRVVLAGTDGAGVLRSTDGGRIWQYASFGLQDFTITALAAAPCWGEREVVYAATPTGIYRSPNGGRAWKPANSGLEGCVVLALLVAGDDGRNVVAGTEAHGIYRSADGGATWMQCATPDGEPSAVNVLWHGDAGDVLLAGTDDGHIWRSTDAGQTWARCAALNDAILCCFGGGARVYAGCADAGLLTSDDAGQTWHADALTARAFTSLHSTATDGALFAGGAVEGVWASTDGGRTWGSTGDFDALMLTAAITDGARFASTADGLLRATDADPDWQPVLPISDITTIFPSTMQDGRVWAGTWSGDLYASHDGGVTWQPFPSLPVRTPVVQIGMADGDLLAVTHQQDKLTLWRYSKARWLIWLEAPAAAPVAQLADVHGETVVSLGTRCFRWADGEWRGVMKAETPILRLRAHGDGLLVLMAERLEYSPDLTRWRVLHQSPDHSLSDFAVVRQHGQPATLCLLTRGGVLLHGIAL